MTIKEALEELKKHDGEITRQQYKTLRGQILSGAPEAAMKGLQKLIQGGDSRG